MEAPECSEVKLVLIDYKADNVDDLIEGSLAFNRNNESIIFINKNLIDSERQIFNHFGGFSLIDSEFVNMFLIVNTKEEEVNIAPGELCVVEAQPEKYPGTYDLVYYKMPDYESIKPSNTSDMIVYKIMAETLQVASSIVERPTPTDEDTYQGIQYNMNIGTILEILGRGGKCLLDVEKVNGFYQPKLKEQKIVICL